MDHRHGAVRRAHVLRGLRAAPPTTNAGWGVGDLLLRKTFTVPAGAGAGTVQVRVDNDVWVYLNGVLVGSAQHEGCADVNPPAPFAFAAGTLQRGRQRARGAGA